MSQPLNVEYVESVLKLALIERKRAVLSALGGEVLSDISPWARSALRRYELCEARLRDGKWLHNTAQALVEFRDADE